MIQSDLLFWEETISNKDILCNDNEEMWRQIIELYGVMIFSTKQKLYFVHMDNYMLHFQEWLH